MRGMERECPMCGDRMRLVTRETVTKVPGTSQEIRRSASEWVCGECDYFEETEESGDTAAD
jgi:C4-type Zn-finger protein